MKKTIGDRYSLHNPTELFDKLGLCQYFSTRDLTSGFYQIEGSENDGWRTFIHRYDLQFFYIVHQFKI